MTPTPTPTPTPNEQSKITLADHAEAWWKEQGNTVPERHTPNWKEMYQKWVAYAFELINGKTKIIL
jgi:hypothetical protein